MPIPRIHRIYPEPSMTTEEMVKKAADVSNQQQAEVSIKVPGTIVKGIYSSVGPDATPKQLARYAETIHDMRRAQPQGSAS